jgi:hypothetical protein
MTTGVQTVGRSTAIVTGAGPGLIRDRFGTKVWNGSDYPALDPKIGLDDRVIYRPVIPALHGDSTIPVHRKVDLPTYSRKRYPRRHYVEQHPYSMTLTLDTDYVFNKCSPFGCVTCTGYQDAANPNWSWVWGTPQENMLLSRLRTAVAGSTFNAGVFLGEGREALSMIADSAHRLALSLRAFRQGNLRKAVDLLTRGTPRSGIPLPKRVSGNWLALQYGWLPLLMDAHDGAEFLAHHLNVPLQHEVTVQVRSIGSASPQNSIAYPSGYSFNRVVTSTRLKAILKEKDVYKLSGLTNPLSIAWELVPYSFVIDWFYPIGAYLENRGLASALAGTFVRSQRNWGKVIGPKLGYHFYAGPGFPDTSKMVFESYALSRQILTNLPIPLPEVVPLKDALSWRRAANAVALLANTAR